MSVILKKIIKISLILTAVFSISNVTLAQESVSNSLSSVSITMTPNNPRAGDSVTLTVSSDLLNLDSAKINWYIDGVVRKDTTSKSITIKAKSNGEKTNVRVIIETSDGIIKEDSTVISPAGIDLIVEPISYTLPFYKGKPFFINQGIVKIVAIPDVVVNGVKIASKDLNFKWTRGETVLGANSGKGKNSIIINGTIPIRDINIQVEVSDDSGTVLTQTSKLIFVNNPEILFYENSPLYGILYNKAIVGTYFLGTREELDITAKPFSFNFNSDDSSDSSYTWYANGNYVVPTGKINELILKQDVTNLKGVASFSLDIKNKNKILQNATGVFNVQFGE